MKRVLLLTLMYVIFEWDVIRVDVTVGEGGYAEYMHFAGKMPCR